MDPTLTHMLKSTASHSYFLNILFNISLMSIQRTSEQIIPFRSSYKYYVCIQLLSNFAMHDTIVSLFLVSSKKNI
jgi:hypothetical protein